LKKTIYIALGWIGAGIAAAQAQDQPHIRDLKMERTDGSHGPGTGSASSPDSSSGWTTHAPVRAGGVEYTQSDSDRRIELFCAGKIEEAVCQNDDYSDPARQAEISAYVAQEVQAGVDKGLSSFEATKNFESTLPPLDFQQVKNLMLQSLEGAKNDLGAEEFARFQTIVRSGRMLTLAEIHALPNEAERTALLDGYLEECGDAGQQPQAFATGPAGPITQLTLIVCPGIRMLAQDLASRGAPARGRAYLLNVMLHEYGHGIDSRRANKATYARFKQCTEKKTYFYAMNYFNELTADLWAIRGTNLTLASVAPGSPEAWDIVAGASQFFCPYRPASRQQSSGSGGLLQGLWDWLNGGTENPNLPKDDAHPAHPFRLTEMYGRNPAIRQALGCRGPVSETAPPDQSAVDALQTPGKPFACTIQGNPDEPANRGATK
jgi:hypothetical protein